MFLDIQIFNGFWIFKFSTVLKIQIFQHAPQTNSNPQTCIPQKIFELKSSMTPTLEIHKLKLYENNDENCFTRKLLIKSAKEGDE